MAKPKKATRAQVGLRVPEDLREKVEYAAKVNGRSLNAEILERLEQSFQTEERFGGSVLFYTAETIAIVMNVTGQRAAYLETGEIMTSDLWLDMPFPYDQAKGAVIAFLESYKPPGKVVVPKQGPAEVLGRRKTGDDPKEAVIFAERAGKMTRKVLLPGIREMLLPGSSKEEQDDE